MNFSMETVIVAKKLYFLNEWLCGNCNYQELEFNVKTVVLVKKTEFSVCILYMDSLYKF
jgi:hypothetical protein